MCYDRSARAFFSAICIAATIIFWLGQCVLTLAVEILAAQVSASKVQVQAFACET